MRPIPLTFILSLSLPLVAVAQSSFGNAPGQAIVSITVGDLPVITNPTSAVGGARGSAFNYQITGLNSPTGYSATGLPAGLNVSSSGLITGTPTAFGIFKVNLTSTNGAGSYTTPFTIDVSPWPASSSTVNAVGSTAGALSVDSSGAAVYDLPIFAPPGVGESNHISL